jgi:peptide deformylase
MKLANVHRQHCLVWTAEFDHLQGVMFSDRVGNIKLKMARKKQSGRLNRAAQRIMADMS